MDMGAIMRKDEILMRGWEIAIYRVYDFPFRSIDEFIRRIRLPFIKIKEAIARQFEYYQDDEGQVKIRRQTGRGGSYRPIEGKLVKTSDPVSFLDSMSFIPWKEANAGYYDEELGVHIDSKQQYRREMKAQGLIPTEATRYCGNIKEKAMKERKEKQHEVTEKAFVKAHREHGGGLDY